jgi:hypothetical protein
VILASTEGSISTCRLGVTSSRWSVGTFAPSRGAPAVTQPCRILYSGESGRNRSPPSWDSSAVAFWRIRLFAGSSGFVRRENMSRVRAV